MNKKFKALALCILVVSIVLNLAYFSQNTLFHIDELTFTQRGKFFDWYVEGDFSKEKWDSYESFDVPKFAELFYGLVIQIITQKSAVSYLSYSGFYQKNTFIYDQNLDQFHSATLTCCADISMLVKAKTMAGIVYQLRLVVIFTFSVFGILFLYKALKTMIGEAYAAVSIFLIGFSPLYVFTMSKAWGDSQLWFFSFLSLYFFSKIIYEKSTRNSNILYIASGLAIGLAIATKLNGVILFAVTATFSAYDFLKHKKISKLTTQILLLLLPALFVFYILNPFLWSNPLENGLRMMNFRLFVFKLTQNQFPEWALLTMQERFSAVVKRLFIEEAYFFSFGLVRSKIGIQLVTTILGAVFFVKKIVRKKMRAHVLLLLWILAHFFITITQIPLNWERYYMPMVFAICLLQAFFYTSVLSYIFNLIRLIIKAPWFLHVYSKSSFPVKVHTFIRFLTAPFFELEKEIVNKRVILDLGCGHGVFAQFLARQNKKRIVLGIDPDLKKVSEAKLATLKSKNCRVANLTLSQLARSNQEFDCIVIVDVVYLLSDLELVNLLNDCWRILKTGGKLYIKTSPKSRSFSFYLALLQEKIMVQLAKRTLSHSENLHFRTLQEYRALFTSSAWKITLEKPMHTLFFHPHYLFVLEKNGQ